MNHEQSPPRSVETLILGAGLTGLSAAYHIGGDCLVAEADVEPGGSARSLSYGQFHLDRGVHILYFRDPWTHRFITEELGVPLVESARRCAVWFDDKFIPFPIQFHFASLPWRQRLEFGRSALWASLRNSMGKCNGTRNMEDWALRHFGRKLTDEFFRPYNEKLWGVPLVNLTTDWMDGYVPKPEASKVLRGLLIGQSRQFGANATFWYPERGGISTISNELAKRVGAVHYGMGLKSLNLQKRTALFHNGGSVVYRHLISSIPLVDLVRSIEEPEDVIREQGRKLHSNPLAIAHILIPRAEIGQGLHWIYVPQSRIPFYRVTLPHNISSTTCPEGWSALTLEIGGSFSGRANLERECKSALIEMELLLPGESDAEVVWDELVHGYAAYDQYRDHARFCIQNQLRTRGVICLGRYGRWEYSNMESALLQGREVKKRLGCCGHRANTSAVMAAPDPNSAILRYFEKHYPKRITGFKKLIFRRGEIARLQCIRSWIPHTEGIRVLDAGCGDGSFLAKILHGTPTRIRLEDLAAEQVEIAWKRLLLRADSFEAAVIDVKHSPDPTAYDVVLALGISDYETDWQALLSRLSARCRGTLVIDFPRAGTLHALLRRFWLRFHGLRLVSGGRADVERSLSECGLRGEIAELPLQWMVRLETKADNAGGNIGP